MIGSQICRRLTVDDLPEIRDLRSEHHWRDESMTSQIKGSVTTLHGRIIGYCFAKTYPASLYMGQSFNVMDVTDIYVVPEMRRQGIGSSLYGLAILAACSELTFPAVHARVGKEDYEVQGFFHSTGMELYDRGTERLREQSPYSDDVVWRYIANRAIGAGVGHVTGPTDEQLRDMDDDDGDGELIAY